MVWSDADLLAAVKRLAADAAAQEAWSREEHYFPLVDELALDFDDELDRVRKHPALVPPGAHEALLELDRQLSAMSDEDREELWLVQGLGDPAWERVRELAALAAERLVGQRGAGDVETVRALFADFNRGDFEAALDKLDEHVEWGEPPDIPDTAGTYVGHDDVVKGFVGFMKVWERLHVELEEVFEVGGGVVALTHWVGRSRGAGIEVDQRVAQLYELRDGKVVRLRQFRERDEALAAAGGA